MAEAEALNNGSQRLVLTGNAVTFTINVPSGGTTLALPSNGTLLTSLSPLPIADGGRIDVDNVTSFNVSGVNIVTLEDSDAVNSGTDEIDTITGGVAGQRLVIIFDDRVRMINDDSHDADTLNLDSTRFFDQYNTLELIYDGTAWLELTRSLN